MAQPSHPGGRYAAHGLPTAPATGAACRAKRVGMTDSAERASEKHPGSRNNSARSVAKSLFEAPQPRKRLPSWPRRVCHRGNPTEVPRRGTARCTMERRPYPPFGGRPSAKGVVMPPGGPLGPGILFGATDGRARLIEKVRWHSPQNCSYFPRFCPQMVFRGSMHRAASNADPREGASP